jgi:hypothetical protein
MKQLKLILTGIFLVSATAISAAASLIISDIADETERDNILASNDVVATLVLRAGGDGDEMRAFEGEPDGSPDDSVGTINWVSDQNYDFSVTYDSNTGNLSLDLDSTDVVVVTPSWFNTITISLDSPGLVNLSLDNNLANSTSFRNLDSPFGGWDGVLIEIPSNNSGNVDGLDISGTFIPNIPISATDDSFRLEVHFLQQEGLSNSVPEPSTGILLVVGILTLRFFRRNP